VYDFDMSFVFIRQMAGLFSAEVWVLWSLLLYWRLFADAVTTRSVQGGNDVRMTSLSVAVDVLLGRVCNSLGVVLAAAFCLYVVVAFLGRVSGGLMASASEHRQRPPSHCRPAAPVSWNPAPGRDAQIFNDNRPSSVSNATAARCCTVTRAFSETKV